MINDYDVVGFDADHCIVKYNVRKLAELMARGMGEELRDKFGYPEEITKMNESFYDLGLNNAVWDIEKRTLLKLVEGK